ncbi:hypothetical protein B1199_12950 [Pseudoalteromonas ulvae]|uniref:Uncharacterized protein n=1 Tax=Pseudoalteromonas ulvae TaxID=107327 RepID=A0A244CN79_PSEDV|nr:hypothetical protein [Pseudoalteromonas ulvae]OUL57080.1 hypothetical protein B1199_12950 [Pseudoalteromonas ulvae]
MCSLVILSKYCSTKRNTLLAEPFGQRLLGISTALSLLWCSSLHHKSDALYKYPTIRCKNHHERSTAPN